MLSNVISSLSTSNIPGFIFSMLIPLLFLIIMIKDKQAKYILSFFCWGICSVILAYIINTSFSLDPNQSQRLTTGIAPIVEETLKALPLLIFFIKRPLNGKLVIYCAMSSGIGFSIQETLFYFTSFSSTTDVSKLFVVITRTITTCLMHGMTTAIFGFGIVKLVNEKRVRIPIALGLLSLSATIHSIFNTLINTRLAIFALIMPAILYFLGLMLLSTDEETDGGEDADA